ncbi:VOC family protein [Pinisolibacter aquiterrae]|uniref:VOC family protein n=1 Tax=Pinisolibacter aquiterrae TaxID=2815579 RepID=UPI001C3CE4E3|nr:VOC family protein [Pinisolibacter aquiterrae]MBV5265818.1 VOC family protein [Pinisolibacter aquiterrae]MCC8236617.1 VOC family protein [Pinisolibacter aquiterrae]
MSRLFGEIRQIGYVVEDIEAAMRHWTETLGIGPWFYAERIVDRDFTYRGRPSPIERSVALANSGFIQMELVQQRNDAPSMYLDFLKAGHLGAQHFAYWTTTFDEHMAIAEKAGLKVGMGGQVGAGGRYVYFETDAGHPGTVIELSEVNGPKGALFDLIRDSSVGWDGRDPIRAFPDLNKPVPPRA